MQTILVVDDSLVIQRTVGYTLQKYSYKVLEALNGQAALDLLEKNRVDLIILDLAMPKMNGLELLKIIRADTRFQSMPVIMLTGSGLDEDKVASRQIGIDSFLTKPASSEELISTIKAIIGE